MMEEETRKWLAARRADSAYFVGDFATAATHAREVKDAFYDASAERLNDLANPERERRGESHQHPVANAPGSPSRFARRRKLCSGRKEFRTLPHFRPRLRVNGTASPAELRRRALVRRWSRRLLAWNRATTADDAILVAAPLYHKNALNAVKQAFTAGGRIVLMPQFAVEPYIDTIGAQRCTIISGVPTMMAMVLAQKERLARTDVSAVSIPSRSIWTKGRGFSRPCPFY